MISIRCAHCGARNRIRGRSHATHPVCGKCGGTLPAGTRWLRLVVTTWRQFRARWRTIALALAGLFLGIVATGWYLYPPPATGRFAPGAPVPADPTVPPLPALPDESAAPGPAMSAAAPEILPAIVPITQGVQGIFVDGKALAPFAIQAPPGPVNYYMKLEDAVTGKLVMALFVHGGQGFRTKVPLGSYKILYATGTTWYGSRYLFGARTRQYTWDKTFEFTRTAEGYAGVRIELGKRANGNLAPLPIAAGDFSSPEDGQDEPPDSSP